MLDLESNGLRLARARGVEGYPKGIHGALEIEGRTSFVHGAHFKRGATQYACLTAPGE
jgi:hypothetical protein